MNKRNSTLSIAAVLAASVFALQAPGAGAAGNTSASGGSATTVQSSDTQPGIGGAEVNVGDNASDRGLPGVEMNIGRDGDQNNVDTRTLGAGTGSGSSGSSASGTGMTTDGSTARPMRRDRG
jgi:hypothetical protein